MRNRLVIISGAILLFALTINAQQPPIPYGFEFKPDQLVYIIAIKTSGTPDPRMQRLLRQASQEKARRRRVADKGLKEAPPPPDNRLTQERREPVIPTLERSISEPDTLTSTDQDLKDKLEVEFRKRKKFKFAASVETADVVFFAVSGYSSHRFQSNAHGITGAGLYGEASAENMMSLVAFAIPAVIYRRTRKDFTDLGQVAQWEGAEVGEVTVDVSAGRRSHSVAEASVKELVEGFHKEALKRISSGDHLVIVQPPQSTPGSSPKTSREEKNPDGSQPIEQDSSRKPQSDVSPGSTAIRIETSLVVIPVSVLDREGRYIPNLARPDFHIYENDVEQEIDQFSAVEAPFHLIMLLDTSDSARFKTMDIQNAALAFIEQLRPQDRVMVLAFDSRIYVNSEFTSDHDQLRRAVYGIRTRYGTRLYDAVDLAITERLKQIQGRKAIVLFTDGVDTESRLSNPTRALELIEESGALLYTIQYDTSNDAEKDIGIVGATENRIRVSNASIPDPEAYDYASRYLAALTERSGGRLYRSENLGNLNQSLRLIAEELRYQYSISYYPMNSARDGSSRRIRVTVRQPDIKVRARAGYRAARNATRP